MTDRYPSPANDFLSCLCPAGAPFSFGAYVYYMSKFYEFIDTVLLILKVSFLASSLAGPLLDALMLNNPRCCHLALAPMNKCWQAQPAGKEAHLPMFCC